jgi:hypothetical protein
MLRKAELADHPMSEDPSKDSWYPEALRSNDRKTKLFIIMGNAEFSYHELK